MAAEGRGRCCSQGGHTCCCSSARLSRWLLIVCCIERSRCALIATISGPSPAASSPPAVAASEAGEKAGRRCALSGDGPGRCGVAAATASSTGRPPGGEPCVLARGVEPPLLPSLSRCAAGPAKKLSVTWPPPAAALPPLLQLPAPEAAASSHEPPLPPAPAPSRRSSSGCVSSGAAAPISSRSDRLATSATLAGLAARLLAGLPLPRRPGATGDSSEKTGAGRLSERRGLAGLAGEPPGWAGAAAGSAAASDSELLRGPATRLASLSEPWPPPGVPAARAARASSRRRRSRRCSSVGGGSSGELPAAEPPASEGVRALSRAACASACSACSASLAPAVPEGAFSPSLLAHPPPPPSSSSSSSTARACSRPRAVISRSRARSTSLQGRGRVFGVAWCGVAWCVRSAVWWGRPGAWGGGARPPLLLLQQQQQPAPARPRTWRRAGSPPARPAPRAAARSRRAAAPA